MNASNFYLRIVGASTGPEETHYDMLNAALLIAIGDRKIRGWSSINGWLCLFWEYRAFGDVSSPLPNVHELLCAEDAVSIRSIVQRWLAQQAQDWDSHPDVDGSVGWEGWEVLAGWTAVENRDSEIGEYEILRIRPRWAEYYK